MIESINSRFFFSLNIPEPGTVAYARDPRTVRQRQEAQAIRASSWDLVSSEGAKPLPVLCDAFHWELTFRRPRRVPQKEAQLLWAPALVFTGRGWHSGPAEPEDMAMFAFFPSLASLVYLKSHYTDTFLSIHSCTLRHLLFQAANWGFP